jgi:hypothetical protein
LQRYLNPGIVAGAVLVLGDLLPPQDARTAAATMSRARPVKQEKRMNPPRCHIQAAKSGRLAKQRNTLILSELLNT